MTYKHLTKLEFCGLTYVYNKTLGQWKLRDKSPRIPVPRLIFEVSDLANDSLTVINQRWVTRFYEDVTPEGALEKWLQGYIEMKESEVAEANQRLVGAKGSLEVAKSRRFA